MSILGEFQTPRSLTMAYNAGELPPRLAYEKLSKSTKEGKLEGAEIAIDQAFELYGDEIVPIEYAAEWLCAAKTSLDKIFEQTSQSDRLDETILRAGILYAYLPLYSQMITTGQLPNKDMVRDAHAQSARFALEVVNDHYERRDQLTGKQKATMNGMLSETAVLLLAQREGIKMGDGSWFAMLSTYNDQHVNLHGSPINNSWDIGIYTNISDCSTPTKLQVKTTEYSDRKRPDDAPDIIRLHLNPDLQVAQKKGRTVHLHPAVIVRECANEVLGCASRREIRRLDDRAVRFHDKIEAHERKQDEVIDLISPSGFVY